jgi:hypothetical protein
MKIKEKYQKENFEKIVKKSHTITEVICNLGLNPAGSNFKTIKKYIKKYDIDTTHFKTSELRVTGLKQSCIKRRIPLDEILICDSTYSRQNLKNRLYKLGLKKPECELCGQGEIWKGKKMSLILDHINGIWNDNRLENLQIVCPNCNATLDTHCGKNLRKKPISQEDIEKKINQKKKNIYESGLKKRIVERPPYEELMKDVWFNGYSAVGRKYGVSDNSIRKWIKFYEKNN